jgi:hypothetical protein
MVPDLCGRTAAVVLSMSIAALPRAGHAEEVRKPFDIAAGPALQSVVEFARQAGSNVLASGDVLAGIETPAVRGTFTVAEALDKLLSRTGLTSRVNASGAIFIVGPDRTSKGDKTVTGTIPMQRRATCCAVLLAFGSAGAAYAQTAPDGSAAPDGAVKREDSATVVVTGMRASLQ